MNITHALLPTKFGTFEILVFPAENQEHVVLKLGDITKQPILTRIHSQCITGDTFSSLRCDCQEQLHKSMNAIQKNGSGILLYLNQEGRGIGLTNKIKAYELQDNGLDTAEANTALDLPIDARNYKVAVDILKELGISNIQLLTNNPDKIEQLEMYGITIAKRIPIETIPNKYNKKYLETKKLKFLHQLTEV